MKKTILLVLLLLPLTNSARELSDVHFTIGGSYPQGNFTRYADAGITGDARITFHPKKVSIFSGWINGGGTFFSHSNEDIILSNDLFIVDASQEINQYAFSLLGGFQIGSGSDRSFFRPRIGIGAGFYLFNTETKIFDPFDDEIPLAEDNSTQFRVGWRGIAGLDLFFKTGWGISLNITYDQVLNLHHSFEYNETDGLIRQGQSARFNNYSIGVVFPLSKLSEE